MRSLLVKQFRQLRSMGWQPSRLQLTELPIVLLSTILVLGLLLSLRQAGKLERLELLVFDQMMRLRPLKQPDARLLVVGITEDDIAAQKQWPLSDRTVAQLLAELQRHHPAAIGLDLARSIPYEPGHQELLAQFQSPNLITAISSGNDRGDAIAPPPGLSPKQVGLVDVPPDADGVIRRNLLFAEGQSAFSIQLVLTYLQVGCPGYPPQRSGLNCQTVIERLTPQNQYELGGIVFPPLQSDSGGYQTINSGGYQLLINYQGGYESLQRVSLTQVLQQQVNPERIRGKIVLIGVTAPSQKDVFQTPYSTTPAGYELTPGVEIQAQTVSQLLSVVLDGQRLFWFWPEWGEWLWIGGWSGASLLLAWRVRQPILLILGEGTLLGLLSGTSFLLFLQQVWIPVAAPIVASLLVSSTTLIYRQYQSQQQQEMVMRLLGQQTSMEIATALWQGRNYLLESGRLPWQKLMATILFSDIKGFSSVSEVEPPEVVMSWLNDYLTAMAETVQVHHGVVNKFIGDSVMAVFGVPIARERPEEIAIDAQQAVHCALAMRNRLAQLNQDFQKRGLPPIQMRVGIFTGPVMVGSLGGKTRLEYGVIGDSVNIASRLEGCEKDRQLEDCRILIAKETLDYLANQFQVENWGPIQLKGKQQLVEVYRVISVLESA